MKLKVLCPAQIFVEEEVTKVTAQAENGSFCLLPRHVDFVAALAPGLLSFELAETADEVFLAVDGGILVKYGKNVLVSTRNVVRSNDLEQLKQTVKEQFQMLDEHEKKERTALARLESNFIQQFMELEEAHAL
ncbi:MAG: F0F1 ATP synthase subunit epsilon [Anaerolineae bacterium]|nr:F0F1 ATP synthase subunit epsilon [Anaerolineae bacterium]